MLQVSRWAMSFHSDKIARYVVILVAGAGLLVCGDAGVKNDPLRAVAIRVRHRGSPS